MDIVAVAAKITGQAVDGAVGAFGAGAVIESLLQELAGAQMEQIQKLAKIERGVDRLLNGKWRVAHLLLQEAAWPDRSTDERTSKLRLAAENLREAVALEEEVPLRPHRQCWIWRWYCCS